MIPRIINDEPVFSDNFDSHRRIAETLHILISNSEGGKTIGLEGAWGSGKSTVIKILEKELSEKAEIYLYKFDAWTHQGEPLRRAFLEGLFENIVETKWFDDGLVDSDKRNKWKSVKAELSEKVKVSTKTVIPEYDFSGLILLFSFLCFPLGSSLLTSAIVKGDPSSLALIIGVGLVSVPFAFTYFIFARTIWKNRRAPDLKEKIQQALGKFLQKGYIADTTKTSETVDPTTIEFQGKFNDFMCDALSKPDKKLVIVIDNLDRISDKEVEAVWPVLRSFIDNPDFVQKSWFKKFWVIIPFAPSSLKPFSEKKIGEAGQDAPVRQVGFLDKVVQINVSVPTPILSNLKKYILDNLRYAFGEVVSEDDVHKIFFIISNEAGKKEEITPRLVISVINNMVATVLQWESISLVSHAYFSVLRRTSPVHTIAADLSSGLLRDSRYDGILPKSIALDLAVLSCNLDHSISAQKLYGDDLETALSNIDGAKRLTSSYGKIGFAEVVATLLSKNLNDTTADPIKLTRKISNLLSFDHSVIQPEHRNHLLQDVKGAIEKLSWIPVGSADFINIISYFCKNDKDDMFLPVLMPVLRRTKDSLETNPTFWYQNRDCSAIVSNWRKVRDDPDVQNYLVAEISFRNFFDELSLPGPFGDWMRICSELQQSNELSFGFPPKMSIVEIEREMKVLNHYSQPVHTFIAAYRSLEVNKILLSDDVIIAAFVARINRQAELPLNEAYFTLSLLIELAASRDAVLLKLQTSDSYWVFYYFATIFGESPRRAKEIDMPVLSPEEPGDHLAPKIIANLLFLWMIQGMNLPSDSFNDPVLVNGHNILRNVIIKHSQEKEIIDNIRGLLGEKDEWLKMILPDEKKMWSGKSYVALKFIEKFY